MTKKNTTVRAAGLIQAHKHSFAVPHRHTFSRFCCCELRYTMKQRRQIVQLFATARPRQRLALPVGWFCYG